AMKHPSDTSLEYAPPLPWHRRRSWRRAVLLVGVICLADAGWRWGPAGWRLGKLLYFQRQCLSYAAAPDQVMYEEDPARGAVLLKRAGYHNCPPTWAKPVVTFSP